MLKQALAKNGLIAILRGLRPQEAAAIGEVLYQAGFRVIEVPLNSPEPYESIRILRNLLPADCLIGAGTVLTPEQVDARPGRRACICRRASPRRPRPLLRWPKVPMY